MGDLFGLFLLLLVSPLLVAGVFAALIGGGLVLAWLGARQPLHRA